MPLFAEKEKVKYGGELYEIVAVFPFTDTSCYYQLKSIKTERMLYLLLVKED